MDKNFVNYQEKIEIIAGLCNADLSIININEEAILSYILNDKTFDLYGIYNHNLSRLYKLIYEFKPKTKAEFLSILALNELTFLGNEDLSYLIEVFNNYGYLTLSKESLVNLLIGFEIDKDDAIFIINQVPHLFRKDIFILESYVEDKFLIDLIKNLKEIKSEEYLLNLYKDIITLMYFKMNYRNVFNKVIFKDLNRVEINSHFYHEVRSYETLEKCIESIKERDNVDVLVICNDSYLYNLDILKSIGVRCGLKKLIQGILLNVRSDNTQIYKVSFLPRTKLGVRNLYELISKAKIINDKFYVTFDQINKYRKDIFIGSPCFESELFYLALNKDYETLKERINFYDYIEIEPISNYSLLNLPKLDLNELKEIVNIVVKIGEESKKIIIGTSNPYFKLNESNIVKEVLSNCFNINIKEDNEYKTRYLNTKELCDSLSLFIEDKEKLDEYILINPNKLVSLIDNNSFNFLPRPYSLIKINNSKERLKEICDLKIKEKYNLELYKKIKEIVFKEIDTLNNKHDLCSTLLYYYSFFNKLNEEGIIYLTNQSNILFTYYLLGISNIDPLTIFSLEDNDLFTYYNLNYLDGKFNIDIKISINSKLIDKAYKVLKETFNDNKIIRLKEDYNDFNLSKINEFENSFIIVPKDVNIYEFTPLINEVTYFTNRYLKWIFPIISFKTSKIMDEVSDLLNKNNLILSSINLNDKKVLSFFNSEDFLNNKIKDKKLRSLNLVNNLEIKEILKLVKINSFSDLVRVYGILFNSSSSKYIDLLKKRYLNNGVLNIKDIISSKEDLFIFLLKFIKDADQAKRITFYIYTGRGKEDKGILRKFNVPKDYIEYFINIEYLLGKSTVVKNLIIVFIFVYCSFLCQQ